MSTETDINIQAALKRIMLHGPDRVLVNASGQTVPPSRMSAATANANFILIRNDGWSLAFEKSLMDVAYRLWPEQWAAFMERPEIEAKPISELL